MKRYQINKETNEIGDHFSPDDRHLLFTVKQNKYALTQHK